MKFTYYQIGLPVNDEPLRTKRDRWKQGQYPLRRYVEFTLITRGKIVRHELRLTDTSLFTIECSSINDADKAFEIAMGFHPGKPPKQSEPLVSVTIT